MTTPAFSFSRALAFLLSAVIIGPTRGEDRMAVPKLSAGQASLSLLPTDARQGGVQVTLGNVNFVQRKPLAVEVVADDGSVQWLTGGYQQVRAETDGLIGIGDLTSPHGTRFQITDFFRPLPQQRAFTVTRQVSVLTVGEDIAFSSRFSLVPQTPTGIKDCDYFVPGIWYKDNAHVPPTALASHLGDTYFYFREDRLPLPLVMERDRRDGTTLALAHLDGDPTTFAGEDGLDRITDARIRFGSLGIGNAAGPAPTFLYPGTEGERTYIFGASQHRGSWALRSHPVQAGFSQAYKLLIQIGHTSDFPSAVQRTWRTVYDLQEPPIIPADLAKVYRDGMGLLATYCHPYNGVISVPFAAVVPGGQVVDTSSQMGFVGQALPVAFLLLKNSLETGDRDAAAHASEVVDFWAHNSLTPADVPRTWYDIHPDGTFTWRNYHTFLRVASDGLDGALQAWNVMRQHGQDRPQWLAFCRHYGDWLVRVQNPDGSFAREYDFAGHPVNPAKDTTDQPIRFLVDLYMATGDSAYKVCALRAGAYSWRTVHETYAYVGGTPDNPNVTDKEGGMMALAAFLSLYDLTQDKKWLSAAAQAAAYSETWVYCWNIPMPADDPNLVFPPGRTTDGLSLIATGHSGADTYMAAAPFSLYRLSLLTGQTHFRDVARMLLFDTKQMLDWDGKLGYKYPGLQTEALSLAPPRGHGVTHWLPWLAVAQLEPLMRMHDVFGSFDIADIERLPESERAARNARFGATQGFLPPKT